MLWEVRHLWAAGLQFAFNTYRHWWKLVLRGQEGLILSKEGVTQGDPLRCCTGGVLCRDCYIPEPSKSILITHTNNIASATDYFEHYNFEIKAGNCYLGGFL
eukprot:8680360-Ditylum_brightwellii.AAC.1